LESRPWVEQTDVRDRILELNRSMTKIISEI